jgi:hypothetical protein
MIGRFISADTIIPNYYNPQFLNRYSYCLNNPLKFTDSTGHFVDWLIDAITVIFDVTQFVGNPSWENAGYLTADVLLGILPFIPAGIGPAAKVGKVVSKVGETIGNVLKSVENTVRINEKFVNIAKDVNSLIPEGGVVNGTLKHTMFKQKVDALGIPGLKTEKTYKGGKMVDYGEKGAVRVDAILDNGDGTFTVWDLKTGNARLTPERAKQIQLAVGGKQNWEKVAVIELR